MLILSQAVRRPILRPYGFQPLVSGFSSSMARTTASQRLQSSFVGFSSLRAVKHNKSNTERILHLALKGTTVALLGLGIANVNQCDTSPNLSTSNLQPNPEEGNPPPLPTSSVSLYELGFGTVAGISAGVFVKKSAKAAAWFLGGIFLLLQYLNSASLIRVDWKRVSSKFEGVFYRTDASGSRKPPTIRSLWNWLIDFLTADFQPRASFIAGFALGLRVG